MHAFFLSICLLSTSNNNNNIYIKHNIYIYILLPHIFPQGKERKNEDIMLHILLSNYLYVLCNYPFSLCVYGEIFLLCFLFSLLSPSHLSIIKIIILENFATTCFQKCLPVVLLMLVVVADGGNIILYCLLYYYLQLFTLSAESYIHCSSFE